jgi:predicted nucleic acid-binding protein
LLYGYLDASALAKRYVPEVGTPEVNHLFRRVPADRLVVLNVGAAEVVSLMVRKRNAGRIAATNFQQVLADFVAEIVAPAFPVKVQADDARVFAAFPLIDTHSLNAADAILLRSALDLAAELRTRGDDLLIVSSDLRLLRACQAERLATFNPEAQSIVDLDAVLGPP